MATTGAAAANAPSRGRTAPTRRSPDKAAPGLDVLDRRHLLERARRRQARALLTLSALLVGVALVLAAAGHALLASDQVRADALSSTLSAAIATQQDEQTQRAQLEAPSRILSIAEHGLKMVTPASVTYLAPVDPGPSVAEAHGAPAPSPSVVGHHASSSATASSGNQRSR